MGVDYNTTVGFGIYLDDMDSMAKKISGNSLDIATKIAPASISNAPNTATSKSLACGGTFPKSIVVVSTLRLLFLSVLKKQDLSR